MVQGTISAPYYVNCTTFDFVSRVFDTVGGSGGATIFDIMQVNSSFRADYAWYLPRIDKLYLSHDGQLVVSKGVSGYYLIPPPEDYKMPCSWQLLNTNHIHSILREMF